MRADALTRFEDNVSIEPNSGCWLWTGALSANGYGAFRFGGKQEGVHRASYQLHVGPIPDGMHVCHHCDNPPCANPQHLFLGTNRDNMRDKSAKRRHQHQKKTHCAKGHAYVGENLYVTPRGWRICKACTSYKARQTAKARLYNV